MSDKYKNLAKLNTLRYLPLKGEFATAYPQPRKDP